MHFSIPDTQELYSELTGTTYTGYNIYINGSYHCCLRYKQLHALHEQIRRRCADLNVQLPATFPPKRLLPLTNGQLESRRASLEHYLQLCGQDSVISKMEHFQSYLLNAQQETTLAEGVLGSEFTGRDLKRVSAVLEVWLSNDFTLQVNCQIGDRSSLVLRTVCECVQLPTQFMDHFCLYLVRRENSDMTQNKLVLIRRLMDFESPYLSRIREKSSPCQVMMRKSYWNPMYDLGLLQDSVALKLLYAQTVADIENEWIIVRPEILQKLNSIQNHALQKEYIQMARQLPLYGCLQFSACLIDYPEPRTTALISIGNKELSMRTAKGGKIYETKFRVTRMRCWRVTAIHNTSIMETASTNCAGANTSSYGKTPTNLQLSFEYLMSKQNLRWITITSAQAMLMSVSLQSMVDELLNCKDSVDGLNTRIINDNAQTPLLSYVSRSGRISHSPSMMTSSISTPSLSTDIMSSSSSTATTATPTTSNSSSSSPTAPVKFLSQSTRTKFNPKITSSSSYSAVFFRNGAEKSVQNEAFEGIGDDDL